ncbi:MAG: hypothetical protein HZA49_07420 [Planctomycetes bacterium]|nr:hypothetical protein [Planctomycetota bacterium]
MRLLYIAPIVFSSLFIYGQTPAKEAAMEPPEITQVKVARDGTGERKVTSSISFSAKSGFKPATVLDFLLAAIVEDLSGQKNLQVAKESAEIKDKKFSDKISPNLTLPPGRYFLSVTPSIIQKNKTLAFSNEDKYRLSASKFVMIGTVAERLEFMKQECQTASKYVDELDTIYKEAKKIIDKSKEEKKPPADDVDFQQWQKKAAVKVAEIDREIAVLMRKQGYITFYTDSFSTLHKLTGLLQPQLKQFSDAVIDANKKKDANFTFTINSQVPRLISDIRVFLTKETLLDLDWFYYALVEDTVEAYNAAKDSPDAAKDWQSQESVCDDYCGKSDIFIAGFKPTLADIWKKHIGKVGDSRKVALEIKGIYGKKINGDKTEALDKKLTELQKNIGELLYSLRADLNKK